MERYEPCGIVREKAAAVGGARLLCLTSWTEKIVRAVHLTSQKY